MARKTYSEHEREQVREALLTTALQCIVDRGLIHSSIEVLCRKVGISKSFFYSGTVSAWSPVSRPISCRYVSSICLSTKFLKTDCACPEA